MPIRFQADADLNQIIVSAVVRRARAGWGLAARELIEDANR
jgi:hypothetical protein